MDRLEWLSNINFHSESYLHFLHFSTNIFFGRIKLLVNCRGESLFFANGHCIESNYSRVIATLNSRCLSIKKQHCRKRFSDVFAPLKCKNVVDNHNTMIWILISILVHDNNFQFYSQYKYILVRNNFIFKYILI